VLRAEFRRRWRTWLMLALIAGLFAGAVQAAAAGARRTDAAYPSLVAWSQPPDVLLYSFPGQSQTFGRFSMAAVARLPQVARSVVMAAYSVGNVADVGIWAPATEAVPDQFWHRKILAGRLANPARPDEVNISFTVAEALHLGVGDILRVSLLTRTRDLVPVSLRVVGIDAAPAEFPPQSGTGSDIVWATPAFYREHQGDVEVYPSAALRLRHGAADLPAVQQEITRLANGKVVNVYPLAPQAANTQRSIHLQVVTLWMVCGLLAVIGLLVLGQLLARLSFHDGVEYSTLRALGMSRGALFAVGLGRAAAVGAAGGVLGALLAVLASPALPVGLAAVAEPHPGIHADGTVLAVGVVGAVLATMAGAAWPAWRAAGAGRERAGTAAAGMADGMAGTAAGSWAGRAPGRSPRLVAAATAGIGSVAAVIGLRLALQPGAGRTALPVRSTIASAVVGVAALTAALVFTASLTNLLATPRLYGVAWDAYVSNPLGEGVSEAVSSAATDPAVAAWAEGYAGAPLTIRGAGVGSIALLPGHNGSLMPVLTQGRLPSGPGEIVLGTRTLAAVGGHLGETVDVSIASFRPHPLKVVGTAVFPYLDDTLGLGKGAALTAAGLNRLIPPGLAVPPMDTLFVRFRPSAATGQAELNSFAAREVRLGPFVAVGPTTPADIVNFGRAQNLPLLLGGVLSLLALLTIAHLLLTSVRRRRRDFAVLRTLGFTRRQVRGAVSWQAGALTGAALGIGIPIGILCGRLAWRVFADQLGIVPVAVVPLATLGVLVPLALALALAIAAVPGESAARARPADILRSE
jgi:ABC-type lipoprotein release transport system permease subunit